METKIKKQQIGYASLFGLFFGSLYFIINSTNDQGNIEFIIKIARYGPTAFVIGFFAFLGACGFFHNKN